MRPEIPQPGEHLTDEALLLFDSDELPFEQRQSAAHHLAYCISCSERFHDYQATIGGAKDNFDAFYNRGFNNKLSALEARHRRKRRNRWVRPLVASVTAASVLLAATLVADNRLQAAETNQVLDKALAASSGRKQSAAPVRFRTAGNTCLAHRPGTACEAMLRILRSVDWPLETPLSVESFAGWRRTLFFKRDSVAKQSNLLTISTAAIGGPIRHARLTLETSDYHPVALSIEPVDLPAIDIVETPEAEPAPPTASLPSGKQPMRPASNAAIIPADPLTDAAIQVYAALHQLNADRGYETSVAVQRDAIEVHGLFSGQKRKNQVAEALSAIPHVRLDLKTLAEAQPGDDTPFAIRETSGTAPRLADAWLKEHFPDSAARAEFVNRVNRQAGDLLGIVKTRQDLEQKYKAVRDVSGRKQLQAIIADHDRSISSLLRDLGDELKALTGSFAASANAKPLTLEQARTIESVVSRLFLAGHDTEDSLEAETQRLQSLWR